MKLTVEFQDATGTYHGRYALKDESGLFVCGITGTDEATAKQLAAAPQLLEAAKQALAVCEAEAELRGENDTDDYAGGAAGPVAALLRAAIALTE